MGVVVTAMIRALAVACLLAFVAAAPASARTRHCRTLSAEKATAIGTTCADALAVIHEYYQHEPECRPLAVRWSRCTISGSRHRYRCTVLYDKRVGHRVSCASTPRARGARVRFTDIIGGEGRWP
jgi:hypothetical protein